MVVPVRSVPDMRVLECIRQCETFLFPVLTWVSGVPIYQSLLRRQSHFFHRHGNSPGWTKGPVTQCSRALRACYIYDFISQFWTSILSHIFPCIFVSKRLLKRSGPPPVFLLVSFVSFRTVSELRLMSDIRSCHEHGVQDGVP